MSRANYMNRRLSFHLMAIVFFTLLTQDSIAQKSKEERAGDLKILMDDTRAKRGSAIRSKDILAGDPPEVLEMLKPYEDDKSPSVRSLAYSMGRLIARSNSDSELRREMVSRLVKGAGDPASGVWQSSSRYLREFKAKDFTENTKSIISQLLKKPVSRREVVRIVGVADMKTEIPALKKILKDEEEKYKKRIETGIAPKWYGQVSWAAHLALARMENQENIDHVVEMFESADKTSQVTRLLKGMAYTRQPEAIEVIERILNSNEKFFSGHKGDRGAGHSQYAMHLLTDIIKDFPVEKKHLGSYRKSEIDLARKWMKKKSNWMNSIRR